MSDQLYTTEANGDVRPASPSEAAEYYAAHPEEKPAEKAPPKTRQSRAKKTDEANESAGE